MHLIDATWFNNTVENMLIDFGYLVVKFIYVFNKDGQSETIELVTSADEFPIE